MLNRFPLLALALVVPVLFAPPPVAVAVEAEVTCIEDWSLASKIVARERLVNVGELQGALPKSVEGAIVRAHLCEGREGYVYRVVVRDRRGHLTKVILEARRR